MPVQSIGAKRVIDAGSFVIPIGQTSADIDVPGLGRLTIQAPQSGLSTSQLTQGPNGLTLVLQDIDDRGLYFDATNGTVSFAVTAWRLQLPKGAGFDITYSVLA